MEGWGYLVCGSRSNLLRLNPTVGGAVNDDRDSRNIPAGYLRLSVERILGFNEQAGDYSEQDRAKSLLKSRLTSIMEGTFIEVFPARRITAIMFTSHRGHCLPPRAVYTKVSVLANRISGSL